MCPPKWEIIQNPCMVILSEKSKRLIFNLKKTDIILQLTIIGQNEKEDSLHDYAIKYFRVEAVGLSLFQMYFKIYGFHEIK